MLKELLKQDSITHLKAGNRMEVTTLRNLVGAIDNREKGGKTPTAMTDQQVETLLRKEVANRRETAAIYLASGNAERAAAETAEADFIDGYLPKMLTEDEAQTIVLDTVDDLLAEGSLTIKDMGRVMKAANAKIAGRFDGKAVSEMVRAQLS